MSSTDSSSSSSSTATVSASPSSTDKRPLITGVTLASIALIVIAIILFFMFRRPKSSSSGSDDYIFSRRDTVVDRSHIASRITPFGAPGGETPQFVHTPGSNMRIANRRSDGAWTFSDPRTPFTPRGVGELDLSPASRDKKGFRKGAFDAYEFEPDPSVLPPPAYAYGNEDRYLR
ncbi:hypothetical protein DFS33DRAFT_1278959 [Desarmillaria ectypa]|nr:hypothetical protein DFS33DRAFT_1278959 [Desarmillaria ectypa]